jgi:hypothetical protein
VAVAVRVPSQAVLELAGVELMIAVNPAQLLVGPTTKEKNKESRTPGLEK